VRLLKSGVAAIGQFLPAFQQIAREIVALEEFPQPFHQIEFRAKCLPRVGQVSEPFDPSLEA
jgi:hypothetical protein